MNEGSETKTCKLSYRYNSMQNQ